MAKTKVPDKLQVWLEARQRYRLSHAQVQMARELGLNPKKFGSLANHRQEPWKLPLPQFIEELYFKRFGKTAPAQVLSLEDRLKQEQLKKQERKARKLERAKPAPAATTTTEQYDDEIPF